MIHVYIILGILIIVGWIMNKDINGGFNFSDEILSECNLTNSLGETVGKVFYIQRTYKNGRIKIMRKQLS